MRLQKGNDRKRTRWRNERPARGRRLGLPASRGVRAGVWLGALAFGAVAGALRGDVLLTGAFPERAAHLRYAVIGNERATARELAGAAAVAAGPSFEALDLPAVRSALAGHPWVRHARVAALPPDRVILAVEEREPVAVARLAGEARLVDRDGTAFAPAENAAGLPELVGGGAPGTPPLAEGVALLDAVAEQGLPAPRALILGGAEPGTTPTLELAPDAVAPGVRVLVGPDDQPAKLARLAELLRAGLPELAAVAEIDLRFGDDVVLRPQTEAEESETRGVRGGTSRQEHSS
ncbi:MAG: FtsQ-type POTRA domain-containing protein [Myxococcota bacterium]